MKLIDVNTSVGHWPFRSLPHRTVDDLLGQMDKAGIDQACVCNLHGLFYKDVQQANEELARDAGPHRDRLIPIATLNPTYIAWQDDLHRCVEALGFHGLRLFPLYHRYEMHTGPGLELLNAAADLDLPVQVPIRVVDPRQMHPLDVDRMLTLDEIAAAVRACPQGRYVVLDHRGRPTESFRQMRDELGATVYFDLAREPVVLDDQGTALLESVGPDRLLFGTAMLHKPPEVALLRFEHLPVDDARRALIAHQNAENLFNLIACGDGGGTSGNGPCSGPHNVKHAPLAVDVKCTADALLVVLMDGREVSAPIAWFPRLQKATPQQRNDWRLIGGGIGIHWEAVDEDISVESLLALH